MKIVAAGDFDKEGRDFLVSLMNDAGLRVEVDRIGNIFGIWENSENKNEKPWMIGSHIDYVVNAGIYDGCYGVMSGLEVVNTLIESGFEPNRPIVVGAFTNEEGIRFQPDMMGSLVYAAGLDVDEALKIEGTDGTILGDELKRICYAGDNEPGFIIPECYIELHVEQGPILDKENISVGVVKNLQGISWQEVSIDGEANHAGTTPTYLRHDAGLAAAKIITYLRSRADENESTVATVGSIKFEPDVINVIPSKAKITIDLRNPVNEILTNEENRLKDYFEKLEESDGVKISTNQLVRFDPVTFDENIANVIEDSVKERGFSYKVMTSGAGHDAQMISRIAPTAMIFVPSIDGISHNPNEMTNDDDIENGANVLLDTVVKLTK